MSKHLYCAVDNDEYERIVYVEKNLKNLCSISSCYRRGRKCKGYRIAKMDGKGEGE